MVRDEHLAEDVTQSVLLALVQKRPATQKPPRLPGWLHRTDHNISPPTPSALKYAGVSANRRLPP